MINQKDLNKIKDDPCYNEILKENLNKNCNNACFYDKNKYLLYLSYPPFKDIYDSEYCGKVFDLIDEKYNIYEECESIFYETDWQYELLKEFKKFKKLKDITIDGTRFYDLDLDQIPNTVEKLDISSSINLPSELLDRLDLLPNLKILIICGRYFGIDEYISWDDYITWDADIKTPIKDLKNIKYIKFIEVKPIDTFYVDWSKKLSEASFMKNIKYRIKNIEAKSRDGFFDIIVELE